tara:strand:- start:9481 stop:10122 length:642 start_codon:yes stop_codon:yes gene_type:complete
MSYNKIINPKTGRKVSINGELGRNIIMNYLGVLQGGVSACANYHTNPIKCQSSKSADGYYCVYSSTKVKGQVGQCKKSTAKDVEKSKESARRRDGLSEKFKESAALLVQRNFKKKHMDKPLKVPKQSPKSRVYETPLTPKHQYFLFLQQLKKDEDRILKILEDYGPSSDGAWEENLEYVQEYINEIEYRATHRQDEDGVWEAFPGIHTKDYIG